MSRQKYAIWLRITPRPRLNTKTVFPAMGVSIIKIGRSSDRHIFIMVIPKPVRRHLYFETPPGLWDTGSSPIHIGRRLCDVRYSWGKFLTQTQSGTPSTIKYTRWSSWHERLGCHAPIESSFAHLTMRFITEQKSPYDGKSLPLPPTEWCFHGAKRHIHVVLLLSQSDIIGTGYKLKWNTEGNANWTRRSRDPISSLIVIDDICQMCGTSLLLK